MITGHFSTFLYLPECCSAVQVTTAGLANTTQAVRLGTYHRLPSSTSYSDRPVYVHADRGEFLFYIAGRARGLWMVGPEVGRISGGLANRGDEVCVEGVTRDWKYADVSGWKTDGELRVECVNVTAGE